MKLPLCLLMLLTMLTACRTQRDAVVQGIDTQQVSSMSARCSYKLAVGKKKYRVNGSVKLQRDEMVQMSFTKMGFELMRMEFTPQQALIIDRTNKCYVEGSYDELALAQGDRLNFKQIQALVLAATARKQTLTFDSGQSTLKIEMTIGNIDTNPAKQPKPTQLDCSKYQQIQTQDAINAIMSL